MVTKVIGLVTKVFPLVTKVILPVTKVFPLVTKVWLAADVRVAAIGQRFQTF